MNKPVAWLIQTKTAHQFTFKKPTTIPIDAVVEPLYTHPVKELDEDFDAVCLENKRLTSENETLKFHIKWIEGGEKIAITPAAYMSIYIDDEGDKSTMFCTHKDQYIENQIPLYTHPAKELHLSLQKEKETGELLAVTYTDDEHRIVEVLWQRPPVKELTYEDGIEECAKRAEACAYMSPNFTALAEELRAILRKAQEK